MNSRNSMAVTLSRMLRRDELVRIAKGRYTCSEGKRTFHTLPTEKEITIYEKLSKALPFKLFCVYNGSVLAPLQHHLSVNKITYVETNRFAMEFVFDMLRRDTPNVWLTPDCDMTYRYIYIADGCIIVKPLITESPVEQVGSVPSPTLGNLLVDI